MKVSAEVEIAFSLALREAERRRHDLTTVEHLLFALLHDELTARIVEKAGWSVETARSGSDALETLKLQPLPNVILSDIEMPRMGGSEFLAALREEESLRNIPIIFISSRTAEAERQQASNAGVAAYLTKPFDQVQLLELINRLTIATEFAGVD